MIYKLLLLLFSLVTIMDFINAESVEEFLKRYDTEISKLNLERNIALFTQNTNFTVENSKAYTKLALKVSKAETRLQQEALQTDGGKAASDFMKRQLKLIAMSSTSKDPYVVENLENIKGSMQKIYSSATIKYDPTIIKSIKLPDATKTLGVGEIAAVFASSTDNEELTYCWEEWRNAVGPNVRDLYKDMVRLSNVGARENKYLDIGDYKRQLYEVDNLEEMVDSAWQELKPFYDELHAFVRYRLSKVYPDNVKLDKPIPAHLLGNLWTTDWVKIFAHVKPFPEEMGLDITPKLKEMDNVTAMIKTAEDFFVSIGWPKLPATFYTQSLFVKPANRTVVCQPGAYDIGGKINGNLDVRLGMCSEVTQYFFDITHHELGHIYYFLFYANLPYKFRQGANPAFHEAVGDALLLSAESPKYLHSIGLLDEVSTTKASEINQLMKAALRSIAFLPYGVTLDKWRWEVFKGNIKPNEYNKKWWEYRLKYQGISPPGNRTEKDFDPAAKFHIVGDVPYIRYFFAVILKHIFHEEACKAANFKGPYHLCSIYNSKAAGIKLWNMLKVGKSKTWRDVLKQFTGSDKMTAESVTNYHKPLIEFLQQERKDKKYPIGWGAETSTSSGGHNKKYTWWFSVMLAMVTVVKVI